ncbi:MAG: hypothetical protein HC886_15155 [Leptolyngbyaceae cyanobacterium SM1_1_3]|nr:hypothetical protein [Leptolyngbyaceae cyanobacterium SM1_1_3]NJN03440.1 hypothetical protein [Leptolyngbyaceae cyanobacterium RM1_1_2]NJO08798.1 hypothetical protein [Leptolyngbyaceae cyanobacterium SL_1_1]
MTPDSDEQAPEMGRLRGDVWSDLRAVKRLEHTQQDVNSLQTAINHLQQRWIISVILSGTVAIALGIGLAFTYSQVRSLQQQLQSQAFVPDSDLRSPVK